MFPLKNLIKQILTWYIMIPMTTHAMQPMTPRRTRKKVLMPDMEEGFGSSTWSRGEEKKEEDGWMPEEGEKIKFVKKVLAFVGKCLQSPDLSSSTAPSGSSSS